MHIKFLSTLVLPVIHAAFCFGQNKAENEIDRIENGLTQDVIAFDTDAINKMNILDRMRYYKVNGVSIAVIENGKIQLTKAYGVADANSKEAVTAETLFQTASIGKIITALAALKLVKDNKITLDEDVNNKLSSWKIPLNKFTEKEKVSLRRLLHHSAGFTDDYGFAGYSPNDSIPSLQQILRAQSPANNAKPLVVNYVPGTQVRYSGGSYLIVQQLIKDLTGLPFAKYVEKEIFEKLNLKQSTYSFYPDKTAGLTIARGHYEDGSPDTNKKYHVYPEQAAAGFWSTPGDLATILVEMQQEYSGNSEKILNRELMHVMLSTQSETSDRGLGVILKGVQQVDGFWHSGQNAGYNSLLYATTTTGQGAVIMLNSDGGIELAQEIARSIANEYEWPFMHTQLVKREDPDSLKRYAGTYKSKEGLVVRISNKQEQLLLQLKGKGQSRFSTPYNLYRTKQGGYILQEVPDTVEYTFSWDKGLEVILHKLGGMKMILVKQ